MTRRQEILDALAQVLPETSFSSAAEEIEAHSSDATGLSPETPAAVVVFPDSTEQVQASLRVAHALRVPVSVYGGGSGLSGAAVASGDGIVIATQRMNRILEINPVDKVVVTQPGVITADLAQAVRDAGMLYAPDPASLRISTVGGNIATDAGGLHCVKYGVTGQSVLALEVVLADGRVIRTGHRSLKGVAGLDLTSLFVGSEGTLGVVTQATLRLHPLPADLATVAVWAPTLTEAGRVVQAVATCGVQPSMLELIDEGSLRSLDQARGTDLTSRGNNLLIIQTDGHDAPGQRLDLVAALESLHVRVEVLDAQQTRFYTEIRRAKRPIDPRDSSIREDIAVPASQLVTMLQGCQDLAGRHGVGFQCVAHAGDGNIHARLTAPTQPDGSAPASLPAAADELVRLALELGGTITGEHGVGVLKRPWLEAELGADQLHLQRQIKAVFDPLGILSPDSFLATVS